MPASPSKHDNLILRPAVESDVAAIVAVEEASFSHPGERFGLRRVRHLASAPRPIVTVAESRGQLVGWIAAFVWTRGKTPWGRIYAIAVSPQSRGQRLGQRLMESMIATVHQRGATRIFLEVRNDNHAAVRLYHKLGFVDCRPLPNYYGAGVSGVRMEKVIASSPAASP